MGDNLLAIAAVALVAFVVAFLMAILTSERVRRQGLGGAIWSQLSRGSRMRNPYKG